MGIVLILPFTRPVARRVLTRVVSKRLVAGFVDVRQGPRPPGPGGPPTGGPVVRGEVLDD
jgi:UPF0716 protein FxsA